MWTALLMLWHRLAPWTPWGLMLSFWAWKTSGIWGQLGSAHYAMPHDEFTRNPLCYGDTLLSYWLDWWVEQWVWHGEPSLFFSDRINFPLGGASALDYSLTVMHTILAGLIQPLVGPSAAINLVVMLGLAVSLLGIFFAVRAVSGSGLLSAVLAVLVVTYGLARGNCLLDPELSFLVYPALALLAWNRYVERGGWRWLAVAALLVGFTGFAHAYYGIALLACLGTAAVLSFCGLSFSGVDGNTMLRRALLVLAVGLGLTLLLHARNIGNLLAVDSTEALGKKFSPPWGRQYTILDGVLVLASVLAPAAVGWLRRIPNATMWGLMCLPVAVISLGVNLHLWGPNKLLNMPLHWAQENLPLFWRLTFPQRFVAPLLVGLALAYGALWRGLAVSGALAGNRAGPRRLAGVVLVAVFWATAALLPLTPDTTEGGAGQAASTTPEAALADLGAQDSEAWSGGTFPPDAGEPGPGAPSAPARAPEGLYRFPKVPVKALLWPFQSVRMVSLPPLPECIRYLAEQEGRFAILELTRDRPRWYIAYFQTIHGKAIAGFPGLCAAMAGLYSTASELTNIQELYWREELDRLPDPAWLRERGVRYVVRYEAPRSAGPLAIEVRRADPDTSTDSGQGSVLDFDAVYGPPCCTDYLARLYETGVGSW